MGSNNIHIASGAGQEDTGLPPQLFAGDTPAVVTQDFKIVVSTNPISQYAPLKRDDTAGFLPWTAGTEIAAVAAYDIPVGTSRAALYVAGMFNIDAIKWPDDTTEVSVEKAQTTMMRFRKLLWSDKRNGEESPYVGPGNEAGGQPFAFEEGSIALPGGTHSVAYSFDLDTVLAGGSGVRTWELESGALPTGASLDANTGVISGTLGAGTAGTYNMTFKVTDEEGNTASQAFTLVVA